MFSIVNWFFFEKNHITIRSLLYGLSFVFLYQGLVVSQIISIDWKMMVNINHRKCKSFGFEFRTIIIIYFLGLEKHILSAIIGAW